MAQYKTGTVTVTSGSNIVTGSGTAFLANASAGDLFKKQGQNVFYDVASVDSDLQLTLSVNYVGTTEAGVSYEITKDFTPNLELPEIWAGDIDWPWNLTRALRIIDTAVAGTALSIKEACRVGTVSALSATYSSSAKTLTSSATEVCTIDGITLSVDDRVLVKDQSPGTINGIYYVTNVGSLSTQWVLSRATDCDSSSDILSGMRMIITEGSVNKGSEWVLTTADPITLDSSTLVFECLGIAGSKNAPMTTSTDPATSAATTTAIIDAYSGVVITLTTTGNAQTIGSPTDTRPGKVFTVVNNDTSTNTIAVNGITLPAGKSQSWIWEGTVWAQIDLGITTIPVPVNQGGTGLSTYGVGDIIYASGTTTLAKLADVAAGSVLVSGGVGTAPAYSASPSLTSITLSGTLKTNATGTVDVAAGKTADINDDLTVTAGFGITLTGLGQANTITLNEGLTVGDGYAVTLTALGQANTLTLNESLTIGDGSSGTITFSAASKTLTVAESVTINALPIGGLVVATSANTIGSLAVGTTDQILVGGGAGTVPAWGTNIPTTVTIGSKYIYRAEGTDVPVADGGTGASTFALNGVLYGNGTNAIGVTAIGAEGQILRVGASPFVPAWTTATYPTTTGAYKLLVSTAANTIGELAASGAAGQYLAGVDSAIPAWATLNQAAVADLKTSDSPAFVTVKLSGLTDGYIPYHASDATGLANTNLFTDATKVLLGDTANAKSVQGFTINQGANDDEILSFKSSDINHSFTDDTEADTYAFFSKLVSTGGGLRVVGLTDSDGTGLQLEGRIGVADPTDTTPAIALKGSKLSTNTFGALGAAETLVKFQNYNTDVITVLGDGSTTFVAGVTVDHLHTASIIAPAASLIIKPTTDATTAIQLADKDGNAILTVDTTNNSIGIGTTHFQAWDASYYSITRLGYSGVLYAHGTNTDVGLVSNMYYDGALKRIDSGKVARISLYDGTISLDVADTGAADSAITMINGLKIDNSGNVGFGTTSFGTSAAKVLALGEGTAPSTDPDDISQVWSANYNGAGTNRLWERTESGVLSPIALQTEVNAFVNPKSMAQSVALTYAASGSSGIYAADSVHGNQTTNSFIMYWEGLVPDFSDDRILLYKWVGNVGYSMRLVGTSGEILCYLNTTSYTSSIATSFVAGTKHKIAAIVTVGAVNTTIDFYVDNVPFGTQISHANPGSLTNTSPLYIMGTLSVRTAGTVQAAYIGNFAPTAAEISDLGLNGIPESWKWGSQTVHLTGWTNSSAHPFETFTSTGTTITAANNTSAFGRCHSNTLGLIPNKLYRHTINLTLTSGTAPTFYSGTGEGDSSGSVTSRVLSAGVNVIDAYATANDVCYTLHIDGDVQSNFSATFTCINIGITAAYESEGIQNGRWLDSAHNNTATFPATGWSLTRPIPNQPVLQNLLDNTQWIVASGSTLCEVTTGAAPVTDGANAALLGNLLTNGGFDSVTTGWTGTDATLSSDAGGKTGNCLTITTVSGGAQNAYQTVTGLTIGKLYQVSTYVKSGTSGDEACAVVIDGLTSVAGTSSGSWAQLSLIFKATATSHIALVQKSSATAGTMLFDSITLYEVQNGYVGADALCFDGYIKDGSGVKVWREYHGANTKEGSFYSMKVTGDADSAQVYWPINMEDPFRVSEFAGRPVSLGCWVLSSSPSAYIGITGTNKAHSGSGLFEWLEISKTLAGDISTFYIELTSGLSNTAYFSQPILVYGSYIGVGNYQPKQGETIWLQAETNILSYETVSSGASTLVLEAKTSGAIGKGITGISFFARGVNSAAGKYLTIANGSYNNSQLISQVANVPTVIAATIPFNPDGNIYLSAEDANWSNVLITVNAVHLD